MRVDTKLGKYHQHSKNQFGDRGIFGQYPFIMILEIYSARNSVSGASIRGGLAHQFISVRIRVSIQ